MSLLVDFILISGFIINIVFLFMIIASKKRQQPHSILIVILTLILAIIVFFYALLHKIKLLFIVAFIFEDGSRLLAGPLIYLYIKSIFVKDFKIKKNLSHFVLFASWWFLFTIPYAVSIYREKIVFSYLSYFEETPIPSIFHDIVLLTYLYLSLKLYKKYLLKSKSNFSTLSAINNNWIKKFLFSFVLLVSIDLLIRTSEVFVDFDEISWDLGYLSAIILILSTVYIGYHGLKQSTFYLPGFLVEKRERDNAEITPRSYISKEEVHLLQTKLTEIIATKKPYLQQELTLNDLAKNLNISDKKLSTFLNKHLNTSFYDLINSYRVEEFKEKINSDTYKNLTFEGVAYSCGFNSKSSFYRIFKKVTGISPSKYKRSITK